LVEQGPSLPLTKANQTLKKIIDTIQKSPVSQSVEDFQKAGAPKILETELARVFKEWLKLQDDFVLLVEEKRNSSPGAEQTCDLVLRKVFEALEFFA